MSDAHTREYVGIMDVMDILSGLLKHTFPELLQEGYVQKHKRLSMMELQAIGIDFGSKSVALFVHGGDLVYKVIEFFLVFFLPFSMGGVLCISFFLFHHQQFVCF